MTDLYNRTLGDLGTDTPAIGRALDRLGLDHCCHGEQALACACGAAGPDPASVASALNDIDLRDRSWMALEPPALADHIVESHHRYLKEELPLLDALADRVLDVHGQRHPELTEVRGLVRAIRADLEPHMTTQEQALFPAIHELAGGRLWDPPFEAPAAMMLLARDLACEGLLARLRAVTGGYAVPEDGCAGYRCLYARLDGLESDTHVHTHKENHALFLATLSLADT